MAPAERSIQLALAFIRTRGSEPVTLVGLSRACGLSASHLQRVFTRIVRALAQGILQFFSGSFGSKELLRSGVPVSVAAYDAGYGLDPRPLRELARWPRDDTRGLPARCGGHGIRYASGEVTPGRVLVAATGVGVCTVLLGARDDSLSTSSRREFSRALLSRETPMPSPWLDALGGAQREDPLLLRVPMSTRRDVFQAKVWRTLLPFAGGVTESPPIRTVASF